jgi:hypothetical protein
MLFFIIIPTFPLIIPTFLFYSYHFLLFLYYSYSFLIITTLLIIPYYSYFYHYYLFVPLMIISETPSLLNSAKLYLAKYAKSIQSLYDVFILLWLFKKTFLNQEYNTRK